MADDAQLLRRVGALDGDRWDGWPGQVTSGGVALARATLVDSRT